MTAIMYEYIHKENLLKSVKNFQFEGYWTFQQDNYQKNTSKLIPKWMDENKINVMTWLRQSPNITWTKIRGGFLKERAYNNRNPRSLR